jgi:hypothetical protein
MKKISIILVVLLICFSFVIADEIETFSEENAILCLEESEEIILEMQEAEFNIFRVNDTLISAREVFEIQKSLKEKGRNYNFEVVIPYCDEINLIKQNANDARYELSVLMRFYEESFDGLGIDTGEVDILLEEINNEITSERYEKAFPLIEGTYERIAEVKASHTALNLFYDVTTRGLKRFLRENWITIISVLGFLFIFYLIFRKPISRYFIKKELEGLELRRKNLKELVSENQRGYFGKGNVSEAEFTIKSKKLAEMIRDIDRQVPLLKERLIKLSKKNARKN